MKKAKKRSKKSEPKPTSKTGLSGLIEKYKSLETKQNPANTAIKSLTEIAAGAGAGSIVSAAVGKNSPLVGVLLVLVGNYLGDKTNLLKTVGIGTIAHGIAKANDYDSMSDPKERLKQLKSDWKKTLRLSSNQKKTTDPVDTAQSGKVKIKVVDEPIAEFNTGSVPSEAEVDGVKNKVTPENNFSEWEDDLKSELEDLNVELPNKNDDDDLNKLMNMNPLM